MDKHDVFLMLNTIEDLEKIYFYIAEQSGFPERAWTHIEKLKAACQKLEISPLRGQRRDDLMVDLRIYPLDKRTVTAFLIDEIARVVRILDIFYGGQDYDAIMKY